MSLEVVSSFTFMICDDGRSNTMIAYGIGKGRVLRRVMRDDAYPYLFIMVKKLNPSPL